MLTRAQLDALVARREAGRPAQVVEVAALDADGWARLAAAGQRIYCDGGILDVDAGELVIVELAPGVSARDLQALVAPTLKVRHDVVEISLVEAAAPRQD